MSGAVMAFATMLLAAGIVAGYAIGYLCGHADARKREPRP